MMGLKKSESVGAGNPKLCPRCGLQGMCHDSRMVKDYVRRRYSCRDGKCGTRWATAEFFVDEGSSSRNKISDYRRREAKAHVRDLLAALDQSLK